MGVGKIWERYFLKEFAKIFFLFMASFCFLYVLVDYSIHGRMFSKIGISLNEVFIYYGFHFVKKAEILIAFALTLATVKVLTSSNMHNELVALFVGGVKAKSLLRPFFIVSVFCMCFLYFNFEFLTPKALQALQEFKDVRLTEKTNNRQQKESIHQMPLSDNSTIVYQSYDSNLKAFFDVFWIRSSDQIFRIKYLFPHGKDPLGYFIDHLIRNTEGRFILFESFEEKIFDEMRFDEELLRSALISPERQSLSQLWSNLSFSKRKLTDKEALILTTFSYKAIIPLICLLTIMAPAPFCVRFNRNFPVFLIYGMSIFLLISFFTFMDAAMILGESQTLSPVGVICFPVLFFFLLFGIPFYHMK